MNSNWQLDPTDHYRRNRATPVSVVRALGYIPDFLLSDDPRPIREQLTERYGFGELNDGMSDLAKITPEGIMQYPEDPELYPLARATHGSETLWVYPHAIIAIVQSDGSLFMSRID